MSQFYINCIKFTESCVNLLGLSDLSDLSKFGFSHIPDAVPREMTIH
jgi:hypothetical protein